MQARTSNVTYQRPSSTAYAVSFYHPYVRTSCTSAWPTHNSSRNGSIANAISPSARSPMNIQSRHVSRAGPYRLLSSR